MLENKNRKIAVVYPTGICNLNCRYCGINKNPSLKTIDEELGKSFEGDYYYNQIRKYFPYKYMLREMETWGGEPFIHMERIYPLVHQLIEYYPYFDSMYSSTNFSYKEWNDKFFGLMDCFGDYPYRSFTYRLQLSCDGPEYVNDAGRGKGTTAKCLTIYNSFLEDLKNNRLPSNIKLIITLKPTLDLGTLHKLCSKEKIIEYYQFFENNFLLPFEKMVEKENISIVPPIPNTAVPSPTTVDDGKMFARFVKYCREIEKENPEKGYFKVYNEITPFSSDICQDCLTYKYGYHTCGVGDCSIGFLPNGLLSCCHEGFTQLVEDYTKLASQDNHNNSSIIFDQYLSSQKVHMCVNEEGYDLFETKMATFNKDDATARLASNVAQIMALALAGQVEEKFLNEEEALKAGIFMQSHTAYCIKDNYNQTGSYTLQPDGMYKLLLNGAMEYIEEGECRCC